MRGIRLVRMSGGDVDVGADTWSALRRWTCGLAAGAVDRLRCQPLPARRAAVFGARTLPGAAYGARVLLDRGRRHGVRPWLEPAPHGTRRAPRLAGGGVSRGRPD